MKRKDIILYLFCAIMFMFMAYILVGGFFKQSSLQQNRKDTKAVIIDFSTGPHGRFYLDYNYFVNGIKHQGSGKYYPKSDVLSVGDTIIIVYDEMNPSSNKPYRDYEYSQKEKPFIIPAFVFLGWLSWWRYRKK